MYGSIKFRSKHITVLLLCLLRNLIEQTLDIFEQRQYVCGFVFEKYMIATCVFIWKGMNTNSHAMIFES